MLNFWYTMQQKGSQNPITKNKIIVKSYTMIFMTMRMMIMIIQFRNIKWKAAARCLAKFVVSNKIEK